MVAQANSRSADLRRWLKRRGFGYRRARPTMCVRVEPIWLTAAVTGLENGAGAILVAGTTRDTAEARTTVAGATPDSGVSVIPPLEHATLRFRPHAV